MARLLVYVCFMGDLMTEFVWDSAFDLLMLNEGNYVNNPNDPGGATKYGISKTAYPDIDIENLTLEQAKTIYKRDYWDRCKCSFIPDALSIALFDFAVNSGVKTAVKGLQKCGTKRAITYLQKAREIPADGIIGNQTIGACNREPTKKVLEKYMDLRLDFLMSLKNWKYFGNGWGGRINRTKQMCEKYL